MLGMWSDVGIEDKDMICRRKEKPEKDEDILSKQQTVSWKTRHKSRNGNYSKDFSKWMTEWISQTYKDSSFDFIKY